MIKIAKHTDPVKLEQLKHMIHNEDYLSIAISRIAFDLTNGILKQKEGLSESKH